MPRVALERIGRRATLAVGRPERCGPESCVDAVELLTIERACQRLVTQYCHLVDHGEAARVAELFTADGVWASPERTMRGQAEIADGFAARQRNARRMSRHVCSNLLLEVEGPEAVRGVVYLTLYRHDGEPGRSTSPLAGPVLVGEYHDRFVRTEAGWRFQRREVVVAFARAEA